MVCVQLGTSLSNKRERSNGLCAAWNQFVQKRRMLRWFVGSLVPVQQMKESTLMVHVQLATSISNEGKHSDFVCR